MGGLKEMRHLQAPPFIGSGIADLRIEIPAGRLRRVRAVGQSSYMFSFKSWEDQLSGVALDLMVKCHPAPGTVELSLLIFEEFNPVQLRKVSRTVEVNKPRVAQRFMEPFQFAPIPGSKGKTYTIVLECSRNAYKAYLLCTAAAGSVTIAGHRRLTNTQPVIIPYHLMVIPWRRYSQDGAPLVSCLIVTYNSAGYIRRCLESISRQDYPNWEIVVVDNQSQDQTVEIIRKEFPAVKLLIADRNLEFAKGNNWGCSQCRGEYIYVLNSDVVLEEGAMRRFVEHIEISPSIASVGSVIDTKGSILWYADTFLINGIIGTRADLLQGARFCAAPCGAGFLIRKSVIDEMGYLFDEGFISNWEDHELGLRCWLHGYLVLHIPEKGLYHDGGGAYGFLNPKRDALIIRNTLLTYFKIFTWGSFMKAFAITARNCTSLPRIWGVVRFLGSFWKYLPARAALQRQRQISDAGLHILTSGMVTLIFDKEK
jgi:GT2 family glycosyltransferase